MSFIFGGGTGMTYEQIQARRRMAEELMKSRGTPRNVGQGIDSFAGSIAGALLSRKVDKEDKRLKSEADEMWGRLFGGSSPSVSTASDRGAGSPSYEARGWNSGTPESEFRAPDMEGGLAMGEMEPFRNAIASIESKGSGDYAAVGPRHPELGRALGRYQIMEANIGPWSREVLGREVTPEEFVANPQIQDAIFDGKFGQYVQQFGPEGAAQAWFAGPGGVGKLGRSDSLGTSVAEYTDKFSRALGQPVASAQNAPMGQPAPMGNVGIQQISSLLSNPYIQRDPGRVAILEALLQRQMQPPMDPYEAQMRGLELRRAQLELDQMQNPDRETQFVDGVGLIDTNTGEVIQTYDTAGGAQEINVQSSEILPNGAAVMITRDGRRAVRGPNGEMLEGEEAARAVDEGMRMRAEYDRLTYGARVEGANRAEAETGRAAAAAGSIGGIQGDFVQSAFEQADQVASSIGNIETAINALDAGARTGAIERYIPNITEASATLQNAMNKMGLDVIGSVTFGALSEGEMRLAMETAVPRNLNEPELRNWLAKKLDAQRKLRVALLEQAQFLSEPNNSLEDWANRVRKEEAQEASSGVPTSFANDPSIRALAERSGKTLEQYWSQLSEGERKAWQN